MNYFESAFELLNGFVFEDKASEVNALWLKTWITESEIAPFSFRAPMVVITGPPGCGKTRLVRSLCRNLEDYTIFPTLHLKAAELSHAARNSAIVLVNEDRKKVASPLLDGFLTAKRWEAKCFDPQKNRWARKVFHLRTLVIVTGPPSLIISEDLRRRSIFIRLGKRADSSPAKTGTPKRKATTTRPRP